jgi:hypothetical protein
MPRRVHSEKPNRRRSTGLRRRDGRRRKLHSWQLGAKKREQRLYAD